MAAAPIDLEAGNGRRIVGRGMLEDDDAVRSEQPGRTREDLGESARADVGIGRIEEDDPEGALDLEQGAVDLHGEDLDAVIGAQGPSILADGGDRVPRVLDEDRAGGPSGQGLEGERTAARIEIENTGGGLVFGLVTELPVGDEHREEGLANPVRGRPGGRSSWSRKGTRTPASAGDAHSPTAPASERTPFDPCGESGIVSSSMARRALASLLVLVATLLAGGVLLPRTAHADPPGAHTVPVAVLTFDSEDADEQADAITGALRSRVRAAAGWSLIETTSALGMLTAAMRCPSRPTPECQAKIGEQLKTERYIWGVVTKGPSQGQVTAEIHLYQRGKPDSAFKESYADNLKDSNDDTLKKVAARIIERLGATVIGVVLVRSADATGEIVIDGEKRIPVDKSGVTRVELAAGGHSIEVTAPSGAPAKRNVLVIAGKETPAEFGAPPSTEPPPEPENPERTRKIIGGIAMGGGVVLGVFAIQQLLHYSDLQDRATDAVSNTPRGESCATDECKQLDSKSKAASGLAIGLGAASVVAIGVGAYFFFTAPSSSSTTGDAKTPPKRVTRVLPAMGPSSGSLSVVGTF